MQIDYEIQQKSFRIIWEVHSENSYIFKNTMKNMVQKDYDYL